MSVEKSGQDECLADNFERGQARSHVKTMDSRFAGIASKSALHRLEAKERASSLPLAPCELAAAIRAGA